MLPEQLHGTRESGGTVQGKRTLLAAFPLITCLTFPVMLNARGSLNVSCCSFRPKWWQMINENTRVTVKVERVVPTDLGLDVLRSLPPLPASHRPHEPLGLSSDACQMERAYSVAVGEQQAGGCSLCLPYGSLGLNLHCKAWLQVRLPVEPSCWPLSFLFEIKNN